jgi:hypothetical protein
MITHRQIKRCLLVDQLDVGLDVGLDVVDPSAVDAVCTTIRHASEFATAGSTLEVSW